MNNYKRNIIFLMGIRLESPYPIYESVANLLAVLAEKTGEQLMDTGMIESLASRAAAIRQPVAE